MKPNTLMITAVLLASIATASAQSLFGNATVEGSVTNSEGNPVAGASIVMFPMDVGISGSLPSATTDEYGRYRLVSPAFGRTRFCAVKESAGYPDVQGLLFVSSQQTQQSRPIVNLQPGQALTVDIVLGPPDGTLHLVVTDTVSQKPVKGASLRLQRDSPKSMYSTTLPLNGEFTIALPDAPINVEVTAGGYLPWRYKDPATGTNDLILRSGEHRQIAVELTPVSRP